MADRGIRIYLGSECANFHALGYLLADLQQVAALGLVVEKGDYRTLEQLFLAPKRPKYLTRFNSAIVEALPSTRITSIRTGSVEIVLEACPYLFQILLAALGVLVSLEVQRLGARITFNINPSDDDLRRHMEEYEKGTFGKGEQGLNVFLGYLHLKGYNIAADSQGVYAISHVLQNVSRRIARTLAVSVRKY